MDPEFEQENIQEINFKNLDDLISKGDFLSAFSKKDLEEVYRNEIYDSSPLNRILKNHWLGYKNLSFVFDRNKLEELYELQKKFIMLNNFSATLIDKVKESISWERIRLNYIDPFDLQSVLGKILFINQGTRQFGGRNL
jgi:hypothetical protein